MRILRLLTACALVLAPACAGPRTHTPSLEPMRPYVTAPLAGARWSGNVPPAPRTIVVPLPRASAPTAVQPVARPAAPTRTRPCPPKPCPPKPCLPMPCLPLAPCCPGGT